MIMLLDISYLCDNLCYYNAIKFAMKTNFEWNITNVIRRVYLISCDLYFPSFCTQYFPTLLVPFANLYKFCGNYVSCYVIRT